jgi:hypothetical protein
MRQAARRAAWLQTRPHHVRRRANLHLERLRAASRAEAVLLRTRFSLTDPTSHHHLTLLTMPPSLRISIGPDAEHLELYSVNSEASHVCAACRVCC